MMSLINGHTTVFQCIADAYGKNDIQRFHYGFMYQSQNRYEETL